MKIILASGSPRRSKILTELSVDFECLITDAPEVSYENEPERTVMENARAKALCARQRLGADDPRPILAADTIVWLDGKIYGKPRDLDEARKFLRTLAGRTHYVFTGVALDDSVCVQTSAVTFRDLSDDEIARYVDKMKPLDRAGAYDIDTNGDWLIANFCGSYENIMGLPIEPLRAWKIVPSAKNFRDEKIRDEKIRDEKIREAPVGFFDSGVGGLCVLDAFRALCPNESTVYLADSANCPYGVRSAEEVLRFSRENVRVLRDAFGCKMIVVACNTATAAAIDVLRRENPDFPFVGIEPAIKPAAMESASGIVGVLATAGTFNGRLYRETKEKFAKNVEIFATVADEWVDFVEHHASARVCCSASREGRKIRENDALASVAAENLVRAKIEPLLAAGCDVLVLGCTHFPLLSPLIAKIAGSRARIFEPSQAVARQAQQILAMRNLSSSREQATHVFLQNRENREK